MNRYVMFLGLVVAGFLAVGMFQAKSGAGGSRHQIEAIKADMVKIQDDIHDLEDKLESLDSPARIAELASERLGMHPARSRQMISLENAEPYFGALKSREDEE